MARGLVAAALAVVALALAVLLWPQGDEGEGGGSLNAIAAAAVKTQGEPGMRAAIRSVVTSEDPSSSFTMTGRSLIDEGEDRSWTVFEVSLPDRGEPAEMEMITAGTQMYMRSSLFAGELPGGRQWMGLDLSILGAVEMPAPTESDAKSELEMLESVEGVRKLGREKVRGVPTTLFGGTIGVEEQVAKLREKGADDVAETVEDENTPLRLEVWIDASERVRRMRFAKTVPGEGGEGPATVDMEMDFFDFGITPTIEVPDSDEVFDMTSLAEEGI